MPSNATAFLKISASRKQLREAFFVCGRVLCNTLTISLLIVVFASNASAQPADEALQRAGQLYNDGMYPEAETMATEVLELRANDHKALEIRAYSRYAQGNFETAIADLTTLLTVVPEPADYQNLRGEAYVQLNRFKEARADFEAIKNTFHDPDRVALSLAICDFFEAEYDAAYTTLSKLISGNPSMPDAWLYRGRVRMAQSRYALAVADFSEAVALAADDALPLAERANGLIELGRYEEAADDFAEALEMGFSTEAVFDGYATALFEAGNYDGALGAVTELLKRFPAHHDGYALKGNCLLKLGRYEEAIVAFTASIKDHLGNARANRSRAICYMHLQQYDSALVDLNTTLHYMKQDPWPFYYRGLALFHQERYADAEQDFKSALLLIAEQPEFASGVAWCQLLSNNAKGAKETLDRAIWKTPENAELLTARAVAFLRTTYDDAACADLAKAVRVSEDVRLSELMARYCNRAEMTNVKRQELKDGLMEYGKLGGWGKIGVGK